MPNLRALLVLAALCPASIASSQEYRTFSSDYWWAPSGDLANPTERAMEYLTLRAEADTLAQADDHAGALDALDRALALSAHDGDLWLKAGSSAYALGEYERAVDYYTRAIELGAGLKPVTLTYNVACCYALLGDVENAFLWLERALLDERWADRQLLLTDTDLAPLHDDPRWARLVRTPGEAELSREERWRHDIDFLKHEAKRLSVQRGQGVGIDAVLERLDAVAAKVDELPDHQIGVHLQSAIAGLGDGHSFVFHTANPGAVRQLPFAMRWFPDGLYVINTQPGFEEITGARIETIGSRAPKDLLPELGRLVSHDNPMNCLWVSPIYLGFPEILYYLGCADDIDSVDISFVTHEGERERRTFTFTERPFDSQTTLQAPHWLDSPPRWLEPRSEPLSIEVLDGGALYLPFLSVQNNPNETIAGFAARLIDAIDEHAPPALIIDVRQNMGGNGNLVSPLLRAIAYFQSARPERPVVMLISRSTFSAAQTFITRADRLADITFVGEPSGSRANFVGESNLFTLPYSNLPANVANRYHQSSRFHDHRIWIAPDVPVFLTAEDFFSGADPVLEVTLDLILASAQAAEAE